MSGIKRIHHINFLFEDLDAAVARFEVLFGAGAFHYENLESRGVRTARTKVGETWFVLVSPTGSDSVPARHLQTHGEGFFLISFGVDDLERAIDTLAEGGEPPLSAAIRAGLDRWRIADLPADQTLGVQVQLTEDTDGRDR